MDTANQLQRKYGLLMTFAMVTGTVIGSGIFFRNEVILATVGSDMWTGVAAWVIGGLITLTIAYVFASLAVRNPEQAGLVGLSEHLVGQRYGYAFGWFLATIFFPSLTGILAWVSARFTVILFGWGEGVEGFNAGFSGYTYMLALFYLVAVFAMTTLSPKLAARFHISCAVLKVIPLILMGVVGTIMGLVNGTTLENIRYVSDYVPEAAGYLASNPFFVALVATIFAYIGWEAVLNIASEVKNPKRNLPIALVGGMLVIIAIYVSYFVGIFSAAPLADIAGAGGVINAFQARFTEFAGTALFVFVIISCLGTLNGLMIGGQKTFYALATKRKGFNPDLFSQVDRVTNMPNNSAIFFLLAVATWIVIYGANFTGWYGEFFGSISGGKVSIFDIAGLVPITLNSFLIPVFIMTMIKQTDLHWFNRFVAPAVATAGASFLIYAVFYTQSGAALFYLGFFAIVMAIGMVYYNHRKATRGNDEIEAELDAMKDVAIEG
ncbi:MAG: APC family permease [Coriobacteriia bacterium]|nr:APC family permease [Coriobacteriia bacterium]MCL2537221.1 APC family permease [Coriobacteriia bacterium]